jgi:FixJ family two-component response regulator
VDVLLTDVGMPHMSGMELTTEVYSFVPTLPVVLITGDPSKVPLPLPSNVRQLLRKPLDSESVCAAILRACDGQRGVGRFES